MTRRLAIEARSVISSSVIPSAKYSWEGSPERFSSGRTASEVMCGEAWSADLRTCHLCQAQIEAATTKVADIPNTNANFPQDFLALEPFSQIASGCAWATGFAVLEAEPPPALLTSVTGATNR